MPIIASASLIGAGSLRELISRNSAAAHIAFVVRYAADHLTASIHLVGIFAYALVVLPFKHYSTLAGSFALALMMIPITLRSTEQFLQAVPGSLREGAMALGASKWKTIASVIVPAAYRGILTGDILLAFACVALPKLLRCSIASATPHSGWNSHASLPVMIYTYAISPYDDWHRQAWAAGLVLLGLILVVNIIARVRPWRAAA